MENARRLQKLGQGKLSRREFTTKKGRVIEIVDGKIVSNRPASRPETTLEPVNNQPIVTVNKAKSKTGRLHFVSKPQGRLLR
jgi:hypothetical protein